MGLDITSQGELSGIVPLKIEVARGEKKIEAPQMITVPEQMTRSSGIAPNFLCDNSSYMLGIDEKGKPERTRNCFLAAKEMHLRI